MSKLRIGLLLDRMEVDKYVLDLLNWARQQDNLEVAAMIVRRASPGERRGLADFAASLGLRAVLAVERLLLRAFKAHRSHLACWALPAAAPGVPLLTVAPGGAAGAPGAAAADLAAIAAHGLDLLVHCGPVQSGPSLDGAARLGAITLDFHGKRGSRAAPPGFWEACQKAHKTEFEIAHLGAYGTPARVLVSGSFPTKFFFLLNQAHLYSKATGQLKSMLKTIAATRCVPAMERSRPYSGPYLAQPGMLQSLGYLARLAARLAAKGFYRAFNIQQKWGISCIHSNWKNAALWNSTRISAPRGHFWADPFVCSHNGKTYCFVEDYVYKTRRGHISVLEIIDGGARLLGDCIKEDFHLSFPFLFRHEGQLYMCPESSEARQIRMYRCKNFPLEWELCAVPMDGVSAADSMFFEHGGKWWMLTNIDRSGLNDHCSELCLFYASSPFDQDWTAHPQNPLRIDADGGRNAGLILEDNRMFRAAQRQGFDQYGKGLALYEIVALDEEVYVERLVSQIDCSYRSGLLGSHHVSTTGKITVFDHVGRVFFP
jgi:hypothetical protein